MWQYSIWSTRRPHSQLVMCETKPSSCDPCTANRGYAAQLRCGGTSWAWRSHEEQNYASWSAIEAGCALWHHSPPMLDTRVNHQTYNRPTGVKSVWQTRTTKSDTSISLYMLQSGGSCNNVLHPSTFGLDSLTDSWSSARPGLTVHTHNRKSRIRGPIVVWTALIGLVRVREAEPGITLGCARRLCKVALSSVNVGHQGQSTRV